MTKHVVDLSVQITVDDAGMLDATSRAEAENMARWALEDLTRVVPVRWANVVSFGSIRRTGSLAREREPLLCLTSCHCDGRRVASECGVDPVLAGPTCRRCVQ